MCQTQGETRKNSTAVLQLLAKETQLRQLDVSETTGSLCFMFSFPGTLFYFLRLCLNTKKQDTLSGPMYPEFYNSMPVVSLQCPLRFVFFGYIDRHKMSTLLLQIRFQQPNEFSTVIQFLSTKRRCMSILSQLKQPILLL